MRCRVKIKACEGEPGSMWEVKSGGTVVGFGKSGDMETAVADAQAFITQWKKDKPKETRVRVPKA